MTEQTEIQRVEPTQSPIMKLAEMVNQSDGKIDAAGLKELLAVQMTWEANEARKAYVEAMAAFKANPPQIVKDRTVSYGQTKYNHASLANVTACINSALSGHGLSAAWKTEQIPATEQEKAKVQVVCKITHIMGHSEETSLSALPDDSGKKNLIQQIGSTVTYLQRYTLLALTGLATQEQDDDGGAGNGNQPPKVTKPTEEERAIIEQICKAIVTPDGKRVNVAKVTAIIYERAGKYPPASAVSATAKWITDMNKPEIFIPENRNQFEIDNDFPGDEHSRPDEPEQKEVRYICDGPGGCDRDFEELTEKGKCPHCLSDKFTDRQAT